MNSKKKPIGRKNYGSIPHLPNSRMGPADHTCHEGQERIATIKARDKHDEIFVQEKLDGSNVGVARVGDVLHMLGRAGYDTFSSPYTQHRHFGNWAHRNYERFFSVLKDGERLVGEWLMQAHGTRYELPHEPFVVFDLMVGTERLPYDEFMGRIDGRFITPFLVSRGQPMGVEDAMKVIGEFGHHGAIDPVEGAVWRVERDKLVGGGKRKRVVDFLVKWVRPDKVDGLYLLDGQELWNNWLP